MTRWRQWRDPATQTRYVMQGRGGVDLLFILACLSPLAAAGALYWASH